MFWEHPPPFGLTVCTKQQPTYWEGHTDTKATTPADYLDLKEAGIGTPILQTSKQRHRASQFPEPRVKEAVARIFSQFLCVPLQQLPQSPRDIQAQVFTAFHPTEAQRR